MKVVIPISTDHIRDKDILDVLEHKENRSEYIRIAIRFYIKIGDNDKTHQMDIREMMEKMLLKMDELGKKEIVYVESDNSSDDGKGERVAINTGNKELLRIKSRIRNSKVDSDQQSIEGQDGFEDISSALDNLGNN